MGNSVKIPRWLELQFDIDFLIFQLDNINKREARLTGIEHMIDESTGYDKIKMKEATRIMKKINKLKKEYFEIMK